MPLQNLLDYKFLVTSRLRFLNRLKLTFFSKAINFFNHCPSKLKLSSSIIFLSVAQINRCPSLWTMRRLLNLALPPWFSGILERLFFRILRNSDNVCTTYRWRNNRYKARTIRQHNPNVRPASE